jgi:predicted dehydrogenase
VLIALVDSDPVALAQASRLCPGVPTFEKIESALQASSAEAWVCATDTPSHVAICKELLAAGRSVLCEQPLADELAAATSLEMYVEAGAAGSGQGKLMVGHTGLFDPEFRAMSAAAANKGTPSRIACQEHLLASSLKPRPTTNSQGVTSPPDLFDATFSDWVAKLRIIVGGEKEPVVVRASAFKGHDAHYGVPGETSAEHLVMAQLLWDDGLVSVYFAGRDHSVAAHLFVWPVATGSVKCSCTVACVKCLCTVACLCRSQR